jgi:uncharacterized damage-inducible protein DinB
MPLSLTFDELRRYTNGERETWRNWLGAHPGALEIVFQPAGELPTVGKLIDHIFLVERRHLQRLTGDPLSESTGLTANNVAPIFDYGASVRRELEHFAETLDEDDNDAARTICHILVHEIRHWAQVAIAVRLAGMEPPLEHEPLI